LLDGLDEEMMDKTANIQPCSAIIMIPGEVKRWDEAELGRTK
jgi:hypothetical protein